MNETISAIYGAEPRRDGEYPSIYIVGQSDWRKGPSVTSIKYREDNFGDHGVGWFDVYAGEARLASMGARHVAEIIYETPK